MRYPHACTLTDPSLQTLEEIIVQENDMAEENDDCIPTDSQTPIKKARFCSNEDDDSQRLSSSDSPTNSSGSQASGNSSHSKLPCFTSAWLEEHVHSLKIISDYKEDVTPSELLDMFQPLYKKDNILCEQIKTIENLFNQSNCISFHDYLDHDFNSLSITTAKKMCKRNKYEIDITDISNLGPTVITWFQRFTECGKRFGEILYNMVFRKEFGITGHKESANHLIEYDFQFLFQEFASMFGLHTRWSAPVLHNKVLQISQGKMSGKADILYCQTAEYNPCKSFEKQLNIVAVCEVCNKTAQHYGEQQYMLKKSSKSSSAVTSIQTRSSECTSSDDKRKLPPHIPLDLLGQHAAELLLYYSQSAKQDVIFGMIIQETSVTFTALNMSKDQYDAIVAGKKLTNSRLIFTKAYDFMKKADRKLLIRPFLEFSMMQKHEWN